MLISVEKPVATVLQLMQNETFMDSNEALAYGFADAVRPEAVRSSCGMAIAKHRPRVAQALASGVRKDATTEWRQAVDSVKARGFDAAKAIIIVDREHPGLRLQNASRSKSRRTTLINE